MNQIKTFLLLVFFALPSTSKAEDWKFRWGVDLPARKPAWQHTQRMSMDLGYSVAAAGGLAFVGCEHNGALVALDGATGNERWRFFTAAPIRHSPVANGSHVFCGSDDGYLYCLDHSGKLAWKFRGGRTEQLLMGHERIMSAWPISTKPLLNGGVLYFVAGYWPVDGIYVHAVDAATGKTRWVNGSAEFRPTREITLVDGKLLIDGDNGNAVLDATAGTLLKDKVVKPQPPQRPNVSGVKGSIATWSQDGGLLAVGTNEGVFGFANGASGQATSRKTARDVQTPLATPQSDQHVTEMLDQAGVSGGYCLVVHSNSGAIVESLLRKSKLHVVVVEPNGATADELRRALDARHLFDDHRLAVLSGSPEKVGLPPYFASLIVADSNNAVSDATRNCQRPFGGVLATGRFGHSSHELRVTRRAGPPAGSADWTHEFQDAANSLASPEKLVKAPFGSLWYGGAAAHARFYFDGDVDHQSGHGLNPQPIPAQVIEGRMILQGPGLLAAIDIYTGRVLWESPLPKIYTFGGSGGGLGIHSKKHPRPWEYDEATKFAVTPTERCRASGFDCVSLSDGIYVAVAKHLLRFDPASGKLLSQWPSPIAGDLRWGNVRVSGDTLIATLFRPQDLVDAQAGFDGNGGDWAGDRMPMSHLIALNRQTGKLLWNRQAQWGFLNRSGICVGGGKVYCVDLLTERICDKYKEAGRKSPSVPPTLYAFDLRTGQDAWQYPLDVYVSNIVYSESKDLLLAPCRQLKEWRDGKWEDLSFDIRRGKRDGNTAGKWRALRGKDGSVAWEMAEAAYHTPHVMLGDLLIDRSGFTYDLNTGKRHLRVSPTSGKEEVWNFQKAGCNHLIACENLVTWRCGYYDLANHRSKTLIGMDAGCSPTLIPAGGVLNIPNFGTHHKRNRMTAMTLIHREIAQ